MLNSNSLFYAWLAGFVDGEGCIFVTRVVLVSGRFSYHAGISISNTFRPVLEEIAATLGYGRVGLTTPSTKVHRAANQYQVNGAEASNLVQHLRPYLHVKSAQADALLRYPINSRKGSLKGAISDEDYILRGQLFVEMKALNTRGM